MATTLHKILYNLRNTSSGGLDSDDKINKLSDRQIIFIIGYVRATLLEQDFAKKKILNPDLIQDLGCVPLMLVDKGECCELATDCLILRSVEPLPKTIPSLYGNMITSVGVPGNDVEEDNSFQFTSQVQAKWSKYNKYTANLRRAFLKNSYLYITNNLMMEVVNVQGVFEDPMEAARYKTCSGKPCFDYDSPYPIEAGMLNTLNKLIWADELGIVAKTIQDNTNDGKDEAHKG